MPKITINGDRLETIYTETINYRRKTMSAASEIEAEATALGSKEMLDSLRGGQGDTAVAAIKSVADAAADLATRVVAIAQFIDSRLAGLAKMRQERAGFDQARDKAKTSTADIKK
jgi:ABC-type transporter Mla subunit MlaD